MKPIVIAPGPENATIQSGASALFRCRIYSDDEPHIQVAIFTAQDIFLFPALSFNHFLHQLWVATQILLNSWLGFIMLFSS